MIHMIYMIYMIYIYICDILPSPGCIAKPMRIEVYIYDIYIYLPSSKLTVRP